MSERPPQVAGRRAFGPSPRPGARYSLIVGLLFLIVIGIAFLHTIGGGDLGTLGLDPMPRDWPLPEFAVPSARGPSDADANVAQDDCETSQLPCPADARRTPACRISAAGAIRVCDFFERPLVISFWFSKGSDGDCIRQQDVVDRIASRYRGRVGFLSLDIGDDGDAVRALLRDHRWRMPIGFDRDGAVGSLYRVGGCPTFAYVYPGGILESASSGELGPSALTARVERLLRRTQQAQAG